MNALTVSRSPQYVGDTVGDDTILIDTVTGAYFSLTAGAGKLWRESGQEGVEVPVELTDAATVLVREGILQVTQGTVAPGHELDDDVAFTKYTDMSDILLADPIHDVDEQGWPVVR